MHEHAMQILVSERDERAVRAAAETLADRFSQRTMGLNVCIGSNDQALHRGAKEKLASELHL